MKNLTQREILVLAFNFFTSSIISTTSELEHFTKFKGKKDKINMNIMEMKHLKNIGKLNEILEK